MKQIPKHLFIPQSFPGLPFLWVSVYEKTSDIWLYRNLPSSSSGQWGVCRTSPDMFCSSVKSQVLPVWFLSLWLRMIFLCIEVSQDTHSEILHMIYGTQVIPEMPQLDYTPLIPYLVQLNLGTAKLKITSFLYVLTQYFCFTFFKVRTYFFLFHSSFNVLWAVWF